MIALDDARATIALSKAPEELGASISMEFAGGKRVLPEAGPELPGKVNYILGKDPAQWKLGLPTYGRVRYTDIYPGIDAVYYGNHQQLEFDLVLKPGADPATVRMKFAGARKVRVGSDGSLVLETSAGDFRLPSPEIYQEGEGGEHAGKTRVTGGYVLLSENEVGFKVSPYDTTKSLVIDPTIVFGAMFGGNSFAEGTAIAVDSGGNIYLAGYTGASDFPTTPGAAQPGYDADGDGFVVKTSSSGTVIYSTYLGGSQLDYFRGIAPDSTGAAWVTGYTQSPDFPLVSPYQGTLGGDYDAVLAKLNPSGALVFSTYLGGSSYDYGYGVAVDSNNNAYVAGITLGGFPTTSGVLYPTTASGEHGFLAKFGSAGSIQYSTLLGGSVFDGAYSVAADSGGNAYVTGFTLSASFVGAPGGGAQTSNAGSDDAFVAKVNPTGTALLYFTFLGGSGVDYGESIQLDSSSPPNAYIGGITNSTNLATTAGVVQPTPNGDYDGFVAKLNGTGSAFLYLTYLGGSRTDYLNSLAIEPSSGDVYVAGYTSSTNFPSANAVEDFPSNPTALFVTSNSGASWSAFDTNIPGLVAAISPDPVTSGTLVAATDVGIFRSTDSGASWTPASGASSATSLSRSPANSSTIYAESAEAAYVSTNGGVTWAFEGSIPALTNTIVADPLTATTAYSFYTFSTSTIYKTTNSGATWSLLSTTGLASGEIPCLAASPSGALYAVVYGFGIYKSTNQGSSWTPVISGLPSLYSAFSALALSVSFNGTSDTLYLSLNNGQIYVSVNGGTSWTPTAGAVPNGATGVAVSPSNASEVYATSGLSPHLYLSTNGGTTWNPVSTGLNTATPTGIVFNPLSSTGAFAIASVNDQTFVAKLNSTATSLVYSTYLGGANFTYGFGIATNGQGTAYVTGETSSAGFPVGPTLPAPPNATVGFVVAISDVTASCNVAVYPITQQILAGAQTVTYGVNAPSGCSWTATSSQSWASVLTGGSGTGAGLVTVQAASNTSGVTRTANISINSTTATLIQTPSSCSYALSYYTLTSVPNAGAAEQVNMTASSGCSWVVANNDPDAITFTSGASGTGDGTINFTISPSAALNSRTLSFTAGGLSLSITQNGVCAFTPSSASSATFTAFGGSSSIGFTATAAACPWTATSNASWITLTSASSGDGTGSVNLRAAANAGAAREGSVTAAGITFIVFQGGDQASATGILSVPPEGGQPQIGGTAQQYLYMSWTSTSTYRNVSISAWISGNVPVTAYLTTQIGPGATSSTLIASVTFTPSSQGISEPLIFSGLTLQPGTYYLVIAAPTTTGDSWSNGSTPVVSASGVTLLSQQAGLANTLGGGAPNSPNSTYPPASTWSSYGDTVAFDVYTASGGGANRTFVATTGNDANTSTDCGPTTPCRTFAAAMSVTNSGGEIVVMDSGGYGAATIAQPVTISAIGVDASITATSGNALNINTTGDVTLNGLGLHGEGTGSYGVYVAQVGVLHLYNVTAENFATAGVSFTGNNLAIYDSRFNDNGYGLWVTGGEANVQNSGFDHNFYGVLQSSGSVTVADSYAHYNADGFYSVGGPLSLIRDEAVLNEYGVSAYGASAAVQLSYCLIAQNTTYAYSLSNGGTISGTSPGTNTIIGNTLGSLSTPGQQEK